MTTASSFLGIGQQGFSLPGGRLTLASGDPYYNPNNTIAVSGQDTSADTITVTAHGWAVGTMVRSSATSGGLTAGTTYYCGNITTNTVSLHTTLAAALAGTSKVDITGTVTASIMAFGVANQTIYYTPAVSNSIVLWTGSVWQAYTFSELSLAIGTVTTSIGYDVFAYVSGGGVTIEQLAWTSATARATAVTLQDGRYCKSGDKTRLWIGSFYSRDTTSTESSTGGVISQLGGKLFLSNAYNLAEVAAVSKDFTNTWIYTSTTIRQANGAAGNKVEIFTGTPRLIKAKSNHVVNVASSGSIAYSGVGVDSTTVVSGSYCESFTTSAAQIYFTQSTDFAAYFLGYHYFALLERGGSSGTCVWSGDDGTSQGRGVGIHAYVYA